jgi:hypothetical protein
VLSLAVLWWSDLHSLYDFLLHHDRRELNLPTLLASSVFLNSTSQALNIIRVGAQTRSAAARTDAAPVGKTLGGAGLQMEYALDITGPIMPASVVRMLALFNSTQQGNFQAYLSSDYPGMNLNCVSSMLVSRCVSARTHTVTVRHRAGMITDFLLSCCCLLACVQQMDQLRNQDSLAICQQVSTPQTADRHTT